MNTRQNTTARWIERGPLLFLGSTLLGSAALAAGEESELPSEPVLPESSLVLPKSMDGLREALAGGTFWATVRYRLENVDQGNFSKDARASTLQTRLGYESGNFNGFRGVIEFSDVSNVTAGDRDYNDDPSDPSPNRPLVADPVGTEVNQVYIDYTAAVGDLRIGRQRITFDNQRFIGNNGWRQTEQNFDSIRYDRNWDSGLGVVYAYVDNVNDVFLNNLNSNTHLLNVSNSWENLGKLTAYGYYLDFDYQSELSSFTYGARFAGEHMTGDWGLLYTLEYAHQQDAEDNTNDVDATYSHVSIGGKAMGVHVKIGFESLEGSSSLDPEGNHSFQTPLASTHDHNGWADQFERNLNAGLEDTYADIGYSNKSFGAGIVLHQFEAEQSSQSDYGDEVDLYVKYNVADDFTLGFKYADFDADSNQAETEDTQKLWIWLKFQF